MVGFGETYFQPFALWLGANSIELGLLMTVPLFLGAVFQTACPSLIKFFGSRSRFIVFSVILQALTFLPMLLSPIFQQPFLFFLAMVSLYQILILTHMPAWNSWMADLLNESERGEFFGFHKRVTQTVVFAAILAGGPLLSYVQEQTSNAWLAFGVLFGVALVARLVSALFLWWQDEPKIDFREFVPLRLFKEIRSLNQNHLGRFILYLALMSFATYTSVPFFAPYMLTVLKLDYAHFALVTSLVVLVRFFCSPAWGALCDRYGCRRMLVISSFGIAFMPIIWVFGDSLWYLCALQILSGIFWAGFELSWFNFMMDSTTKNNRAQFFTLQQLLCNLAMVFGSLLGGVIIYNQAPGRLPYHEVFILSATLRLLLAVSIVLFIKEVRMVSYLRYRDFAGTFFRAVLDYGVFFVPQALREQNSKTNKQ